MKLLNIIILRGLPGTGKSFLATMMVHALRKKGLKVLRLSKDKLREKAHHYIFTPENEVGIVDAYREQWKQGIMDKELDVLISDNTNIKQEELKWHFYLQYPRQVHFTVIEIGDAASDIRDTIPINVQARMRINMVESDSFIQAILDHDMAQFITMEPRAAIEEGIGQLIKEIIY